MVLQLASTALQAVLYCFLEVLVHAHSAWRAMASLCTLAAVRLAAVAPALRPLLAAFCALPHKDHIGSWPLPPSILGVAVAEEVQPASWPAAVEALGHLLAW